MTKRQRIKAIARNSFKDALTHYEQSLKYSFYTSRTIPFSDLNFRKRRLRDYQKLKNAMIVKADMELWNKRSARDTRTLKLPAPKQVRGADTETIDGKLELWADSYSNTIYQPSFIDMLEFFYDNDYDKTINMFYNLKYDANALLRLIDRFFLVDLHVLGKTVYENAVIELIPKKMLKIKYRKRTFYFFDILQHYYMSLDQASEKYLGVHKLEMSYDDLKSRSYWNNNLDKITEYCIWDAFLTEQLGKLAQELYASLGLNFNSPISTAYMAELFAYTYTDVPYMNLPEIQKWGYYAYGGGWFEIQKRGYDDDTSKLDINSAYPKIMSNLPDLRGAQWVHTEHDDQDVQWGLVKAVIRSRKNRYLQPLPVLFTDGLKYPQTGWHIRYMGLEYFRDLQHRELIDTKSVDYMLMYPRTDYKPFAYMNELYRTRRIMKDNSDNRELPRKILMNSTYGKFIQVNDFRMIDGKYDVGNMFLPIYAHWTTEGTRHQILNYVLDNAYDVYAIHTDSIIVPGNIKINDKRLGMFATEKTGEYLGIGTGVYAMRDGDKVDSHFRGIYNSRKLNMFELLETHKHKTAIEFTRERPLGLGEIVMHTNKRKENYLNQWIDDSKALYVNADTKRKWNRNAYDFGDLLHNLIDSKPLKLKY